MSPRKHAPTDWTGLLLLSDGFVGYLGPGSHAAEHAHHAVQVIWSFGRPVEVTSDGSANTVSATIIPAHRTHGFDAHPDPLVLVLVEPHSRRGRALDAIARTLDGTDISDVVTAPTPPTPETDVAAIETWCNELLDTLVAEAVESPARPAATDLRAEVAAALEYIEVNLGGVPRLADAAAEVGLSPSRLTHLFTAQVGMPFRRFVLWSRIKRATDEVKDGRSMTDAAASAGFADSGHFSRVFVAMFGLAPSAVLPIVDIVGKLGPTAESRHRSR